MTGKLPHWQEKKGSFYARLAVPPALRNFLDEKSELRIALGNNRVEAKRAHARAVAELRDQIDAARLKAEAAGVALKPATMTRDQMLRDLYRKRLDADARSRDTSTVVEIGIDDRLVADLRRAVSGGASNDELADLLGQQLAYYRKRSAEPLDPTTPHWRDTARDIARTELEVLERVAERDEGNFNGRPQMPALLASDPEPQAEEAPAPLMTLFDGYFNELARSGRGAEAMRRWRPIMADFVRFVGHDDAKRFTKRNVLDWKDDLLTRLSAKTVKDSNLAALKAVLKWAVDNDRITANPAADVKVRATAAPQAREKGFTDEEAVAILSAVSTYTPKPSANPQTRESIELTAAKRWMPWLCAFTGARPAELAQLRGQDVREKDGVHYLRITPDAGSVKTGQFRDVPLHPQLVERGFLDLARAAGEGPLFYRNKPGADPKKASKTVSGRVSEWLRTLDAVPEGVDPQYGWRHRMKTVARELGIDVRVVDAIQGHAARTAGENYGDVTIKARKAAIDKLPRFQVAD